MSLNAPPAGCRITGWVLCRDRIELLRRLIDAFNAGDLLKTLACLHPNVEARPLDPPDVVRGHDGVRAGFVALEERFEQVSVEPGTFVASGDHVMVPVHRRARPRDGGAGEDARIFQVYSFTDGKVSGYSEHPDESAALIELGLDD
jgi:ketosteroid isomerase-like protein